MEPILYKIRRDYPDLKFQPGEAACWAPQDNTIFYSTPFAENEFWSLCHEIGHAIAGHKLFDSDIDLLLKETEAWETAKKIANRYNIKIENEYIQNCLDSYRDWLHKRSTCPQCQQKGMHQDSQTYSCPACLTVWEVNSNQLTRPYRRFKQEKRV